MKAVAALVLAALLCSARANDAVVVPPRPFGHALGDVVTQRIRLDGFEPGAVQVPQRAGAWFERRRAEIERAPDGVRWLVVDYQVVNVPPAPATLRLPAWDVPSANGAAPLHVGASPLGVAPLVPPAADGDAPFELRPDRPAPSIALAPLRRALGQAIAATLALAAAWAAWWAWRQARARSTQPFAQALRALRASADESLAWRSLHAAFDRTAGEVLRPSTLARLFERAPHLEAQRVEIERFFAQSDARFFGAAAGDATISPLALCRALRRLERAHER